jgi:hypothetical protein
MQTRCEPHRIISLFQTNNSRSSATPHTETCTHFAPNYGSTRVLPLGTSSVCR